MEVSWRKIGSEMKSKTRGIEVKGKRVLVVGLGISGFYASQWLAMEGARVVLTDIRKESELNGEFYEKTRKMGVKLELGKHNKRSFFDSEMIVISPGVASDMPEIKSAAEKGIPVIGELELAGLLIDTPIIAVTGTNGKTTVTSMIGELLEKAGHKIFVGGNIGLPLMAYVIGRKKAEYAVLEVSSFQLDTINKFKPYISVILNITPDHLDRYSDFGAYINSKLRIYMNQGKGQYLIINDDDKNLSGLCPESGVTVLRYGFDEKSNRDAFLKDKTIQSRVKNLPPLSVSILSSALIGKHNLSNMISAALCGQVLGIDEPIVGESLNEFKGLKNRLEWVKDIGGVAFFNDSKATNLDSAIKAVTSIERPIILIAGGLHKGADYHPLVEASKGKVKKCVFIGKAKKLLADAFEGVVPIDVAEDMEEAVYKAYTSTKPGDAVLLAPACSSFDMYKDYADRGEAFRIAVERLQDA